MSGNPQLGPHPDAEMLNAFTEQMLAEQERQQVAAHLAVCGRCREVVFVAQEASGEMEEALVAAAPAASQRVVQRTSRVSNAPRFMKWRLAWIPAAALAAISIAYVAHIRHQAPAGQMTKTENPAAPLNAVQQPPQPAEIARNAKVAPKQTQPRTKGLLELGGPGAPLPRPSMNAPVRMDGGDLQDGAEVALELKAAPEGVAAQKQPAESQAAGAMREPAAKKAVPMSADRGGPTLNQTVAVSAAAPAPMMQAEVSTAQAARSGAAKANSVHGSFAALANKRVALPSGLAAMSMTTVEHTVLAVDKAGSTFLSADGGEHWESIGRQWNGQAVAVRSVEEPRDKSAGNGGSVQTVFELVNDAGQVWVSVDGRSWKPK